MAVAIFGAADVSSSGLARLHIGLEMMVSGRIRVELDVHGRAAVGRRGPVTCPLEFFSATPVGLVVAIAGSLEDTIGFSIIVHVAMKFGAGERRIGAQDCDNDCDDRDELHDCELITLVVERSMASQLLLIKK